MALTAEQMARLSRLLDEALALDPRARARWLRELSPADAPLLPTLQKALLEDPAQAGPGGLDTLPRIGQSAQGGPRRASLLRAGQRVGPYELIRPLGAGGMAEVWLARRADGAYRRELALKLPVFSEARPDLAARFARERDILAALEHPNIARLYDAGVGEDGLPYLALEYVQGTTLVAWCDARRLDLRARLKLFLQVLDAVRYAHERKVVHRDIKPSNVLVTDAGQVRLLDFGVARLLAEDALGSESLTQAYGRALTPEYASPEQLRAGEAGPGSDIYSLGVMFYELLCGSRPFGPRVAATPSTLEREIAAGGARLPSSLADPEAGEERSATKDRLAAQLRGDLDAIALTAVATEVERRYASATDFADDIKRFLDRRAVRARRATLRYLAGRYLARRRVEFALVAAILVALGATLGATYYSRLASGAGILAGAARPLSQPSEQSIAVLPFLDLSEKHDQEFFSDGLSEELIDRLGRASGLRVIARTSSFQFKGRNEDAREIARKLGVAHLLEGSVRRAGPSLRVSVQLVRASDGSQIWSETFDRGRADVFQVQDEIASRVAGSLKVLLRSAAMRHVPHPDAYSAVLEANYHSARFTEAETEKAAALYKKALQIDPRYARAYAGLAIEYLRQATHGWAPADDATTMARWAAQQALEIDPGLAYGHMVLGTILRSRDWNWEEAQREFSAASELEPADPLYRVHSTSIAVIRGGSVEGHIQALRQVVASDPLNGVQLMNLGWALMVSPQHVQESPAVFQRLEELNPSYALLYLYWGRALLFAGHGKEALALVERERDPASRAYLAAVVHSALGHQADSDAALRELEASPAPGSSYLKALAHGYRGESAETLRWLQAARSERDSRLQWILAEPTFRWLHGDSRFQAFLAAMNLRPSATGSPPRG